VKLRIELKGPRAKGARVPVEALRDLLEVITEGTRRSLRIRLEGRSVARGPVPGWLVNAASFDLVGLTTGSTVLEFESESLASIEPDKVGQLELFEAALDVRRPAVAFFLDGLRDTLAGKEESDLYDRDLVETYGGFSGLLACGFDAVEFVSDGSLELDREGLQRIEQLRRKTPDPRRIRVAGRLDMIRFCDRMFTLILASGKSLRGVAAKFRPNRWRACSGRKSWSRVMRSFDLRGEFCGSRPRRSSRPPATSRSGPKNLAPSRRDSTCASWSSAKGPGPA
jgi:hypothetical protein